MRIRLEGTTDVKAVWFYLLVTNFKLDCLPDGSIVINKDITDFLKTNNVLYTVIEK